MTSLAGVHDEGQVPLDLRVRRDKPENDLFSPKGSAVRSFPAAGGAGDGFAQESDELLTMHDSLLKIVQRDNGTHYDYNDETVQYRFTREEMYLTPGKVPASTEHMHGSFLKFIKEENGRFDFTCRSVHLPYPAEREFYPNQAGTLNVTVKQEPEEPETDESYFKPNEEDSYFKPSEDQLSFAGDFLPKVEENSSDEDNLIIDLNIEESKPRGPSRKRLDRSNSNCSTVSNSSCASETGDDIRTFLRTYSGALKEHQCIKCKERFTDLYSLFVHLDEHVSQNPGEKFMRCPVCMRKFQRILGIAAHIRKVHMGPLEHACKFCQAPFKYQLHLQKHVAHCRYKKKKKDGADESLS